MREETWKRASRKKKWFFFTQGLISVALWCIKETWRKVFCFMTLVSFSYFHCFFLILKTVKCLGSLHPDTHREDQCVHLLHFDCKGYWDKEANLSSDLFLFISWTRSTLVNKANPTQTSPKSISALSYSLFTFFFFVITWSFHSSSPATIHPPRTDKTWISNVKKRDPSMLYIRDKKRKKTLSVAFINFLYAFNF